METMPNTTLLSLYTVILPVTMPMKLTFLSLKKTAHSRNDEAESP